MSYLRSKGPRAGNRWAALAVIFLARISTGFQFQSIPSVAPFLVRDVALSYADVGWLIGIFSLPGVVISLPGGLLGQRYAGRRLALIALGLMAVGALLTASGESVLAISVGRIVGGAGVILVNVTFSKMVADWFADSRLATAMAVMLTAWPAGIALALLSLGPLATAVSWHASLYLTAGVVVVSMLVMLGLYRDPPRRQPVVPAVSPVARPRLSCREILLSVVGGSAWGALNAALLVFVSFTPAFLLAGGTTIGVAGAVVSLVLWTTLLSVPLGGFLADRFHRGDWLIAGGSFVAAAAMVAMTRDAYPAVWCLVAGLALGLPAGPLMSLLPRALRAEVVSVGFGAFYTVYYSVVALAQPLAGWVRDLSAHPEAPLLVAAVFMAGVAPGLLAFRWLERAGRRGGD